MRTPQVRPILFQAGTFSVQNTVCIEAPTNPSNNSFLQVPEHMILPSTIVFDVPHIYSQIATNQITFANPLLKTSLHQLPDQTIYPPTSDSSSQVIIDGGNFAHSFLKTPICQQPEKTNLDSSHVCNRLIPSEVAIDDADLVILSQEAI